LGSLLPSLRQLRFLDLSLSKTPLSAKVFESLPMVRYLDLSLTQAALDKAAFRSWLARAGNELECLLLARPPSNAGPEFACDDEMLAALGSSSPSLALLDVSYCRTLTSRGLRSLAACARLQVLKMAGVADHIDAKALAELIAALPLLHHFELRRRGCSDISVCFPI